MRLSAHGGCVHEHRPHIRAGTRASYRVDVYFDRKGEDAATAAIANPPLRPGPGWYRGDFHMHDAHSDGSCATRSSASRVPCPLFRTAAAAAAAGLDFVAITDHNTVAHAGALRELQPWFDRMLLIQGVEVTTFHGHANIFAPNRFVDFRLATRRGIAALQDDIAASGAIMSVNHPALPSGEICMGCGWTWSGTDWSRVAAVEVINGKVVSGPLAGTGFWHSRLNEGHRLTGIAGSDNHDPDAPDGKAPAGRPTTVVRAAELSQQAVLDGVRAGEVFIDVEGTRDRLLEVTASRGEARARMGGRLAGRGAIQLKVHTVHVAGAVARVIADGATVGVPLPINDDDARLTFEIAPGAARRWLSVTVDRNKRPILIGNPIYVDGE